MDIRSIIREAIEQHDRREYLAWKRKNVSYRGVNDDAVDNENGGGARFGRGLYTAALSNKKMSREYGKVYFVVNAVPKNPKVFDDTNQCEIWIHRNLFGQYMDGKFPSQREFHKHTTIEAEMMKLGYDGILIKGREMVNYAPPSDVFYSDNEDRVYNYWRHTVRG